MTGPGTTIRPGDIVGGCTFVPNILFDELLPNLRDSELRLLLVVCRQTLGRSDGRGGRQQRDILSQSQLKRRTGRASEAISRAIDSLVRQGLLLVFDDQGRLMLSPAERRSARGRLSFALSPRIVRLAKPNRTSSSSETEHRKPNTTKRKKYERKVQRGRSLQRSAPLRQPGWVRVGGIYPLSDQADDVIL